MKTTILALLSIGITQTIAEQPVITKTWTNKVPTTLQVVSVTSVEHPCPECGQVNHHNRQITLMADYNKVYTEIVYQGRTNQLLVSSTVVTNYMATNFLYQAWSRVPPALPVSTNQTR